MIKQVCYVMITPQYSTILKGVEVEINGTVKYFKQRGQRELPYNVLGVESLRKAGVDAPGKNFTWRVMLERYA